MKLRSGLTLAACSALACAAPRTREVDYLTPDQVPLTELRSGELAAAAPAVRCALELADSLARHDIGYHHDQAPHVLRGENLQELPPELSCSEFAWYVYRKCGVDLGDRHPDSSLSEWHWQMRASDRSRDPCTGSGPGRSA